MSHALQRIHVLLTSEQRGQLEAQAIREDRTLSQVVREAVREYLERRTARSIDKEERKR